MILKTCAAAKMNVFLAVIIVTVMIMKMKMIVIYFVQSAREFSQRD